MQRTAITSSHFFSRIMAVGIFVSIFFFTTQHVSAQFAVVAPSTDAILLKSSADQSIQTVTTTKEWLQTAMQQVAKGLAMQVLKKFTQETVNWINQGNDGKPLYVTNTGDFFDSIADEQVKILTNKIGYDPVNHPFGKDFLQYYITAYARKKLDPLATNTYTLPATCASSFSWSCWEGSVNNPGNNPFGAFFETSRAIDQKINTAVSIADKEVSAAGGFLAMKTCELFQPAPIIPQETVTTTSGLTSSAGSGMGSLYQNGYVLDEYGDPVILGQNPNATGSTGNTNSGNTGSTDATTNPTTNPANATTGGAAPCEKYRNSTPGTVVGNQITTALSSGARQNELAAALGNSVSAVFDALYNRFIGGEDGLLGLATNQLNDVLDGNSQQDTFNYYGVTLGNANANANITASDWASGPDVIVDLNQVLDVPYDDGTLPATPSSIALTSQESDVYKSIVDTVKLYPSALRSLDRCLPGPDYGWESRFRETVNAEDEKINRKVARRSDSNENADAAANDLKGIKQRVDIAIITMRDRMLTQNIPSAITIYDTIQTNAQKSLNFKQYYESYLEKKTLQKRLEIMKSQLQEGDIPLITLIGQYQILQPQISRADTLATAQSEKTDIELGLTAVNDLTATCIAERQAIASTVTNPGTNSYLDGFVNYYEDVEEDNPFYPNGNSPSVFLPLMQGYFPQYSPVIQQNANANYPSHMFYYCKSVINDCPASDGDESSSFSVGLDHPACITLDGVFKSRNFEVSCFDFYQSETSEYLVGSGI